MKKQLLLGAACLMSLAGMAQTLAGGSTEIENAYIMYVSPDGSLCASMLEGYTVIHNLVTDESWPYFWGEESWDAEYTIGNGNPMSRNGIIVGSTSANGTASYWENGKWQNLKVYHEENVNLANGISSDGSIIVGSISPKGSSEISVVPAIWKKGENGEYGEPTVLPYPELDFSGRIPQYVLGISISDDGNVVVGQVVDYTGMYIRPIIFENVEGEWKYNYIDDDLLDPSIKLPEYPGTWEEQIDPTQFMSPEAAEEYNEDIANWTWNTDYPDPLDYMTDAEKEEYLKALAELEKKHAEWEERYDAFQAAFDEFTRNLPAYSQNNANISPDGTYFCATASTLIEDPDSWFGYSFLNYPIRTNIKTGKTQILDGRTDCYGSKVMSDGTVICFNNPGMTGTAPGESFVILPNSESYIPIENFIASFSESTAKWMKDNMTKTYEEYTETEDGLSVEEKTVLVTANATCTPDYRMFLCCSPNIWDYDAMDEGIWYYSWLITFPVEKIKIPETIEVVATNSVLLEPVVEPVNATLRNDVVWRISDHSVATVNNGLVTGVAEGETDLQLFIGGQEANSKVKVLPLSGDFVQITDVALNVTEATVRVGETLELSASVLPENATNKTLVWSTSAPEIATVDQNGVVSGIAIGNATITVQTTDGSNIAATCEVSVSTGSAVEEIVANSKIGVIYAIDGTVVVNDADAAAIRNLPKGIYIVTCDGLAEKYIKK